MFKFIFSLFLIASVVLVGCSETTTTNNYYYYPESQNIQSTTNIDNSIDSEDHRSFTSRNM